MIFMCLLLNALITCLEDNNETFVICNLISAVEEGTSNIESSRSETPSAVVGIYKGGRV